MKMTLNRTGQAVSLVLSLLLLSACASVSNERPVLYPNAAYKAMGEAAARQHLDQCVAMAAKVACSRAAMPPHRGPHGAPPWPV